MMLALWLLTIGIVEAAEPHCWEPSSGSARRLARRGERAVEGGDLARAELLLRASAAAEPDCGAVAESLGAALLADGRPDEARVVLTPAVARFPEAIGVLILLARVATQQDESASARLLARQALSLDPANLDALVLTNDLLRTAGDWPAVEDLLSRHGGHHDPADVACLRSLSLLDRGQLEAGRVAMDRCVDGGQPGLVAVAEAHMVGAVHGAVATDTAALQAVNLAIESEDWEQALSLIDALPPPLELSVRIVRATCLYNLERLDEALADLEVITAGGERLLSSDPERVAFYTLQLQSAARMQARTLGGLGRVDDALAAVRAARSRLGQDYDLHRTEIFLLARSGQATQAALVWQDAVSRWPEQPDLFGALSDIIAADRGIVTDEMWSFLGRSRSPADQFAVATQLLESGDASGCLRHADKALQLGSADSDVANLSYHCAVKIGDLTTAQARREQLGISAMPVLLIQHGLLVRQSGDVPQARALLEEACGRMSGADQAECLVLLDGI
ncbi:MAG: tetratricopeptide repeat protein [Myxococcota bacterium]|nr:tetratricopeptide repeat protein [Myxococcota bacterium]